MKKLFISLILGIFLISFVSSAVTTTLNSPADASTQYTKNITFNGTGSTSSGSLSNMSLYTNETGSWTKINLTTSISTNTDSIPYSLTSTYSGSAHRGYKIDINKDLTNVVVTKHASVSASTLYLLWANGTQRGTYGFFSNNATLTEITLLSG